MGLMLVWADDFRAVFWVAIVPGFLAVALLVFGVQEPERDRPARPVNPVQRAQLHRLPAAYWQVVGFGALFMLARFSEAFLVLRAQQGGLPLAFAPLVLIGMNVVFALAAYPFGRLSDRLPHGRLLVLGLATLVAADLCLAYSSAWAWVWAGISLWGLHLGMTQGLLAKMVADTAPPDLRGTGYGFFNLLSGLALLVASVLAGLLWERLGATTTFLAGAAFSVLAILAVLACPAPFRSR
jgi:predicted MFS family arabinose efflux permease